ncbi:hypothetical protein BDV18DRAFT_27401 [Aspergillus unguis]
MHFKKATIIAFLAYMASAAPSTHSAGTIRDTNETSGEPTIPDATWTLQVFPGGPEVNFTGTAEQVYAQLTSMNPNYDEDWKDELAKAANESASAMDYSESKSKKYEGLYCVEGSGVLKFDVGREIAYLRKVNGKPHLPAHTCERVACSWGTGIHWCNDADHARSLPSYNNIADGAQVVRNECFKTVTEKYKGDLDHRDEWRAIVKDDNC